MKKIKNILFIVVDCLRADYIYDPNKTHIPNINELKTNGFYFLNTITTTSTTTPSFSSLLTGLYPFESGVRSHSGYALNKNVIPYPKILKNNGYYTYAEVTGPVIQKIGLDKGFDEFNYRDKNETIHKNWGKLLIKKFISEYKEPWFVLLHIWALHEPRMVLTPFNNEKYGDTLYARSIASIDKYLGELFNVLKENTLIILTGDHGEQIEHSIIERRVKRTIEKFIKTFKTNNILKIPYSKIIRPFHIGHGYSIYDVLVKVPLIFYDKETIPHGQSNVQIRHIDVFPTILDLVEIKTNNEVSGKSLIPIIEGKDLSHRDAYLEAVGINIPKKEDWLVGLRIANKYKFIMAPFLKNFKEELYLLEKDPLEKRNVANYYPQLIEKFKKKIENLKYKELIGERLKKEEQDKIIDRLRSLGYVD
ncbi:MAG: sulfatase [Promethearchaeota archaeon]